MIFKFGESVSDVTEVNYVKINFFLDAFILNEDSKDWSKEDFGKFTTFKILLGLLFLYFAYSVYKKFWVSFNISFPFFCYCLSQKEFNKYLLIEKLQK